ncbi:hypothetical protein L873DRAFT_1851152 [Choiromyces venosus 120613-1]|uniref:Uncharacterized protein n=1 Tax=Choiromyces venosus 120613-1 TaxID=1336337 RepID=A0A3N4KA17_9PEZI|nr:hypothetical protein L873DRAFT_1851152 [Choiromyces venosus 120613-1]
MNVQCKECKVLHWIRERVIAYRIWNLQLENCCKERDIALLRLKALPELLNLLLSDNTSQAKVFQKDLQS